MPNKKSNQKGFTLVELLISVAIIAILSTMGIASFQNYSNREAAKNSAMELGSIFKKYQNYAISGQKNLMPGVTDTCSPDHFVFRISQASGSSSGSIALLTIDYSASPCADYWGNGVIVDSRPLLGGTKIAEVGYRNSHHPPFTYVPAPSQCTNAWDGTFISILFHYGKIEPELYCSYAVVTYYRRITPGGSGGNYDGDAVYAILEKNGARYRVVFTIWGQVYEEKAI